MRVASVFAVILALSVGASVQADSKCKSEYTDFDLCAFSSRLAEQMAGNLPMRVNKNMSIESVNSIDHIVQFNAVLNVSRVELKDIYDRAGMTFEDFRRLMENNVDNFCAKENPVGSFIKLGGVVRYTYRFSDGEQFMVISKESCE